ncbi:MAG: peptidoglycan-binding protein, partial [Clostridia bacterium]|nr:peptidoglycan-binding protein [Clostridia bacterium]
PGGNGEHDLRTHQYLIQLGNYKAVANWSYSGSDAKIRNIRNNLKPGYIFLFHCKSDDLKKLEEFIPYAVAQGYELVTLNDLLGYPANEVGDYSAASSEIPAPLPFVYGADVTLGNKEYIQLYAVQLLQNRLIELGYLSAGATVDGDYGSTTKLAVKLFQYYNALTYDGYAGAKTQEILFSSQAKRNPSTYIAGEPETYPVGEERALFES